MNTVERIKQATGPQDALLIIAHALDAIWAEIQELKGQEAEDEWGAWEVQPLVPLEELKAKGASAEVLGLANIAEQRTELEVHEDGSTTVTLPTVSEERKDERRKFAERLEGIDPEDYAKGGPLWLYYADRDLVIQLPSPWLVEMVEDVTETSPSEAHEFARDVLKDHSDPGVDYAVEMDAQVS